MMRAAVSLILLSLYVASVISDEYHPRNQDPKRLKKRLAGAQADIGEGLHKIPYADWKGIAQTTLNKRIAYQLNTKKAKNVIFVIGDGMGISSQTLARYHKSEMDQITMDKVHLSWDEWINAGVVKTYNSDAGVADSAGTATAFMCGIKARSGVIGVDERVVYNSNCSLYDETHNCKSALRYAQEAGKLTGIVSTARITHATPACAYSHSPNRNWEYDSGNNNLNNCEDIAHQLIYDPTNQDIRVILGGGRRNFFLESEPDTEYPGSNGYRRDINLIEEWKRIKREAGHSEPDFKYVWKQDDFDAVDPDVTKYLFGLFEMTHMQYDVDRAGDTGGEPSLAEMVEKAIKILRKSDEGYFLYVEGGRIDHAHHASLAQKAAVDTWALSEAVQKAIDMTNPEDTLIVVTADHSHVLTLNGYTHIDSPLYGPVYDEVGDLTLASDGLPYQAVSYANGPGHGSHMEPDRTRKDLTDEAPEVYNDPEYRQSSLVPLSSETHGGEDVGMYARGPWSHLFSGSVEQHYLATAMMYASCINPEMQGEHCKKEGEGGCIDAAHHTEATALIVTISLMTVVFFRRIMA